MAKSIRAALGLLPGPVRLGSQAELVRVQIASRVDVLNGKAFGEAGPYEKIWGKAYFAVDPAHPRNQIIADIALAPRNRGGQGRVLGRPLHPQAEGSGARQRRGVLRRRQPRTLPPAEHVQRRRRRRRSHHRGRTSATPRCCASGFTLVAVGWQFDVPDELIGVQAPIPTNQGAADQGLGARVVHHRSRPPTPSTGPAATPPRAICPVDLAAPDLPAHRPRRHVRRAAAHPAGRLAVRPRRRRPPRRRSELRDAEGRLQARPHLRAGVRVAESARWRASGLPRCATWPRR